MVGKFCHNCGQKQFSESDKDIKSFFSEAFHFVTHFEGTFFTSLKAVLFQPGKLSVDYCNGIRKKYYKPISFFMLLVVLYLLFPFMGGMNMQMKYYKNLTFSGSTITQQIQEKAAVLRVSEEALSEIFHQKSEKVSKVLLFLLLPLTALVIALLPPYKWKNRFYDIFVLSTEINIVVLLQLFFILPLVYLLFIQFGIINDSQDAITPISGIVFAFYLILLFRKFYQIKWLFSGLITLVFLFLYAIITQVVYKFLLFQIVIHLI
jgi:hypothetical protein